MGYIQEIQGHWMATLGRAKLVGANDIQMQCLRDLSKTEFKAHLRLRRECLWSTVRDSDGDIILRFRDLQGEVATDIEIDIYGLMTHHNRTTGEQQLYSPFDEARFHGGFVPLIWTLNPSFLKSFTEPAFKVYTDSGREVVMVTGNRNIYSPYVKVEHTTTGFAKLNGGLVHTKVIYEDEVTKEKLYCVFSLTKLQKVEAYLARGKVAFDGFEEEPIGYSL